jgi:hypothetical protein
MTATLVTRSRLSQLPSAIALTLFPVRRTPNPALTNYNGNPCRHLNGTYIAPKINISVA